MYHFIKDAGIEQTREIFDDFRQRCKDVCFEGVHINAVNNFFYPGEGNLSIDKINELCEKVGVDSISNHGNKCPAEMTEATFDYQEIINTYEAYLEPCEEFGYGKLEEVKKVKDCMESMEG